MLTKPPSSSSPYSILHCTRRGKVMRIMKLAKYRLKAQVEKDKGLSGEGQSPRVEKDEGPSGEG